MNAISIRKSTAYILVGLVGLALAAAYLVMAFDLPFGRMDQPGAAIFPIIVGITLVLAAISTVVEGMRAGDEEEYALPAAAGRGRVALLVALLIGYVLALPLLGQFVAGAVFIAVLMRSLSNLGWPRILLYSLVMAAALHFVFVTFLKVPLPTGALGIDLP